MTEVSKEMLLLTETNQTSVAAIKADFLIAKSMARTQSKGHLVSYDAESDSV